MYVTPPSVADAFVNLIVGTATVNVIASPGPGQAIRVVGGQLGVIRTSTGITDLSLKDVASGSVLARLDGASVTGTSAMQLDIPEPGIQLTANSALQLSTTSTAATGQGTATIYYYIDTVN